MTSKVYGAWMSAGLDMWMLGAEATSVIALRTARIAAGGLAGAAEAELMVKEKIDAAIELQMNLVTGVGHTPLSATQATVRHYRRKVAANNKRLSRMR